MKKNYQTKTRRASTGRVTPRKPKSVAEPELVIPSAVSVVMTELTEEIREGLLALAVGSGLQVMQAMMAEEVATTAKPI